jgi:predicted RNase H-like nuclease (RuvC/YqgF family)
MIIQTEDNNFGRDLQSKALINTDTASFSNYKEKRKKIRKEAKDKETIIKTLLNKLEELSKTVESLQERIDGRHIS